MSDEEPRRLPRVLFEMQARRQGKRAMCLEVFERLVARGVTVVSLGRDGKAIVPPDWWKRRTER